VNCFSGMRSSALSEMPVKSLRQSLLWTRKTNERVDSMYDHDFIPLPTQANRLFDPMKTIEKLFTR
jgi:hypothetical protein